MTRVVNLVQGSGKSVHLFQPLTLLYPTLLVLKGTIDNAAQALLSLIRHFQPLMEIHLHHEYALHACACSSGLKFREDLRRRGRAARLPHAGRDLPPAGQAGRPGLVGAEQPVGRRAGGTTVDGGSAANPLKARWMGLANGVGIHGTGEDYSIGSGASHGCIRMHVADVNRLFPAFRSARPSSSPTASARQASPGVRAAHGARAAWRAQRRSPGAVDGVPNSCGRGSRRRPPARCMGQHGADADGERR